MTDKQLKAQAKWLATFRVLDCAPKASEVMRHYKGGPDTDTDLLDIVNAPLTIAAMSDGWVLMRKAGVVGVGSSPYEAGRDLLSKLTVVITHLKWQA